MGALPPIRSEVTVAADPVQAFEAFTDDISAWWPMANLNVLGDGSLVGFDRGRLVESTAGGDEAVWGEVHDFTPGQHLSFSWHPGEETPTEVTVDFSATDGGTQVALEHAGWEARADPAAARAEYEPAWPLVLAHYRRHVGAGPETAPGAPSAPDTQRAEDAETWVALMHTPGPTAPAEGSLFADPRFAEHIAFLQRMSAQGYLVAAGPLTSSDGSGMTILRLPGADRLVEVIRLANVEDGAVAGGLLAVSVRPWDVMFHALG